MDNKNKIIKLQGKVIEVLPGTMFKVELDLSSGKRELIGYISGKMRMHYIKLQKGDIVDLEVSPYDLTKGRIIYRH